MPRKLTKSMVALLRSAVDSPSGLCGATIAHGRGCRGLEGGRLWDAGCKLATLGLLTRHGEPDRSVDTKAGWSTHYTTAVWKITEPGRAALATHYGHNYLPGESLVLVTGGGNEVVRVTDVDVGKLKVYTTTGNSIWVRPESVRRPVSPRDGGC